MVQAAFTLRFPHSGQRASLGVVSVPSNIGLEGSQQQQRGKLVIHLRDDVQSADDLNMFLGCSSERLRSGFCGLSSHSHNKFPEFLESVSAQQEI